MQGVQKIPLHRVPRHYLEGHSQSSLLVGAIPKAWRHSYPRLLLQVGWYSKLCSPSRAGDMDLEIAQVFSLTMDSFFPTKAKESKPVQHFPGLSCGFDRSFRTPELCPPIGCSGPDDQRNSFRSRITVLVRCRLLFFQSWLFCTSTKSLGHLSQNGSRPKNPSKD